MMRHSIIVAVAFIALSGCSSSLVQTYAGPALSEDRVAVLEVEDETWSGIVVSATALDGAYLKEGGLLAILPGPHRITFEALAVVRWQFVRVGKTTVDVTFVAGGKYLAKGHMALPAQANSKGRDMILGNLVVVVPRIN